MVLGVVLGFMIESNYRRALVLSNGDLFTFLRNPISAALLATALVVLVAQLMRQAKSRAGAR
jgi:putative tricarboxylic transport membrane protein